MEINDIAHILSDVWLRLSDKPEWESFIKYNDLALPFAFGIDSGMVLELSTEGEDLLRETYDMLCDVLKVDKNEPYPTLDDMWADADWES